MGEKFPGWWRLESITHSSFIKPQSNTLTSKQVEVGLKIEGVQDIMGKYSSVVLLSLPIDKLFVSFHYALFVTITALRRSKKWQRNILLWPYDFSICLSIIFFLIFDRITPPY